MWASILRLLSALADWFRNKQLIDAGKAEAQVTQQTEINHEVAIANEARDQRHAADANVPDTGSLPDDGFRRD